MNILNLIAVIICSYFGIFGLVNGQYGLAALQLSLAAMNLLFVFPR